MWDTLRRIMIVRDVRNKLLFTLVILLSIRILDHIPIPLTFEGRQRLLELFNPTHGHQGIGQLFGVLDVLSGGSISTFSLIALSVYPYITATIVMQLLQPIIPALHHLSEQGEKGRHILTQITRIITIPLAFLQAISICAVYQQSGVLAAFSLIDQRYALDSFAIVIALIAGVMIMIWLGELITEKGIGNGISLIIFGGIISHLPSSIKQGYLALTTGNTSGSAITIGIFLLVGLLTIVGMVYMYKGQRRIYITYPTKRSLGRGGLLSSSQTTYIPMQLNSAGMIPLIFASSFLLLPSSLAQYFSTVSTSWLQEPALWALTWVLTPTSWWYWLLNALFVFAFTYFYAYVVWQQQNIAEKLQKQGAFVQGLRPGEPTNRYLTQVLYRITLGGAVFLAIATILPFVVRIGSSLLLSSISLLIVVGVILDTVRQLDAELETRNYSGFLK